MTNPNQQRRGGAVLVAALVALLIVMAMLASMLEGTLRARRQLHVQRDLRQTELLLQAGVERAALQLARDASFRGDTWNVPAESLADRGVGRVTTEISQQSDDGPWIVRIVAEFPLGTAASIRRSREFQIPISTLRSEE
jgi:hypothetical protein